LVLFQGAHFSRDTINRPGFAKLFFEAASEERQHAIKIISYLLMRGELTSEISKLIQNPVSNPSTQ
jgi:ferritin heavy chain